MHYLKRWPTIACLALSLTACTATSQSDPDPASPSPSSPGRTAFRYQVGQLENALPATYDGHRLGTQGYIYPVNSTWTLRPDPLAGRKVVPSVCRSAIWNGGATTAPGGFIPDNTPSASASTLLGPPVGQLTPNVRVSVVELTGELAEKYLNMLGPTLSTCAHVTVDGREQASAAERSVVGFGARSRFVVRTFPVHGRSWTERILYYRTDHYAVEIRQDGYANPEPAFLAFAGRARDRLVTELRG